MGEVRGAFGRLRRGGRDVRAGVYGQLFQIPSVRSFVYVLCHSVGLLFFRVILSPGYAVQDSYCTCSGMQLTGSLQ